MSSFQKLSDTQATINGTKLKNNFPLISSGIPSLDHVIEKSYHLVKEIRKNKGIRPYLLINHVLGGGLPAGSVFAVEEDVLGNYSRVMIKYFLAEGVVCKHALLVASGEENPKKIVKELPIPCAMPPEDPEVNLIQTDAEKMKIAWRYEGLSQVESSFGSNTSFGHHFDLTKHIDEETIKSANIEYCRLTVSGVFHELKGFKNKIYGKLLKMIKELVSKEQYRSNSKNSNILRISIQSLGSPIWLAEDCVEEGDSTYGQDLIKFMYCLRVLLRDTNAVAFVTIPGHLFDDDRIIKRILYTVDNAVKIESFAGSSRETNPVFKDYHGLFHVTKLSALYSLVQFVPPSLDLAFKLKRKKFLIEKLHLPPELEETSEREQDDITAIPSVSCGGFKKKDIDF